MVRHVENGRQLVMFAGDYEGCITGEPEKREKIIFNDRYLKFRTCLYHDQRKHF